MTRTELQHRLTDGESLYTGITVWAAHAPPRILAAAAIAGFAVALTFLGTGWERIPAAGLPLTIGSIGAWGLLEQRNAHPHTRRRKALQWAVVWLGIGGALAAGLGLLLWVMGPAPIL